MNGVTTLADLEMMANVLELPMIFKNMSTPEDPGHIKLAYFRRDREKYYEFKNLLPILLRVDVLEVPDVMGSTHADLLRLTSQ